MLAAGQQPLGSACRAPCICAPGCTASTRRQQSPRIDATTSAVQLHAFQRGRGGTQCKSVAAGHSMHSVDDSVTDGPSVLDTPAASAFPVKPMQTSQLRGGLLQTIHQSTIGRPPIGRRPSIASADSQPAVRVPRISRRHTLLASAAVALGAPLQAGPAQAAEEAVCARVARSAGRLSEAPGQPWSARLQGKEQVYYPKWMFGEWEATTTGGEGGPLSPGDSVPPLAVHSLQRARSSGLAADGVQYRLKFYSTLPDTLANTIRMNLGQVPEDTVVADRAFNLASVANAAAGTNVVEDPRYDPSGSPDQMQLTLLSPNGRRQGVQLELARLQGQTTDSHTTSFCTAESYKQEVGGLRSSYEVMTVYRLLEPSTVAVTQREVYYGQSGWLAGGGDAVAEYTYSSTLRRLPPPEDARGAVACVTTFKGYTQCM